MNTRLLVALAFCLRASWSGAEPSPRAIEKAPSAEVQDETLPPSERESLCDSGGTLDQVHCLAAFNRQLDGEMNAVYRDALSALPVSDSQDSRKAREQLRRSQRAWLPYVRENCTLQGGQEGDSNLWVTYFAALCEERELRERIRFLKGIAGNRDEP
jgi:uncharacterized protein YecT (DUF1311 family)